MVPVVSFSGLLLPAIYMLLGIGFVTLVTIGVCVYVPRWRERRSYVVPGVDTVAPSEWDKAA